MNVDMRRAIWELRVDQLVRVARALYDPAPVGDHERFERDPPTLNEAIAAVADAVGADASSLTEFPPHELARRVILDAAERDGCVRDVVERARTETMSSATDAALLIGAVTYALAKLVRFEADNSGRGGRTRWRVRIGGDDGGIAALLREWVRRLGGGSTPPTSS